MQEMYPTIFPRDIPLTTLNNWVSWYQKPPTEKKKEPKKTEQDAGKIDKSWKNCKVPLYVLVLMATAIVAQREAGVSISVPLVTCICQGITILRY